MPTNYQSVNNLKVSEELLSFINNELLEGIEINPKEFWIKFTNSNDFRIFYFFFLSSSDG